MVLNSPGLVRDTLNDFLLVRRVITLLLYYDTIKMFADESVHGIQKLMVRKQIRILTTCCILGTNCFIELLDLLITLKNSSA